MKVRNELNARLYRIKMDEIQPMDLSLSHDRYNSICIGDLEAVNMQLQDGTLLPNFSIRRLSNNSFINVIYHLVLAASSIETACVRVGMGKTEAQVLSDIYILKMDDCNSESEALELYKDMCMDFAERMQEIRKESVISIHIRKSIDYIYENLGQDLSLGTLASEIGLHPSYLSRLFRRETGISLKRFVKEARVDTAQNLLRYSDHPYLVISNSLGFSTQSVFISVFKEITGMTPKVYREKYYSRR